VLGFSLPVASMVSGSVVIAIGAAVWVIRHRRRALSP
jgi:hypothetical protein